MNLKTKKGGLLIAEPSILNDFSFNRSVILLTEHSEKSSVGFIINRPTQYTVNSLLPDILCNFTIYEGGPVEQDNLYFTHKVPHLLKGSNKISKDLFWGGNFEDLQFLLNEQMINQNEIRFFLGYSGWGINQLEDELKTKLWFINENSYENIFAENIEDIWKNELLKKGGEYKIWANAPNDIQQN